MSPLTLLVLREGTRSGMRVGSYEHRALFCDALLSTHRDFRVNEVVWPALNDTALAFVRGVPFFGTTLATERRAAAMLAGFADTIADPMIADAVRVQGLEEWRHGELLASFLHAYEVAYDVAPTPPLAPTRAEFLAFGYQESLETFLGWGVFAAAGRAELFPKPFLRIFETLLADEARHITFFANFVAYERVRMGRNVRGAELRDAVLGFGGAALRMLRSFTNDAASGPWFTQSNTHAILDGIGLEDVLESSLAESRRYLADVDPRLKRPRFVPACAEIALALIRRLPPRAAAQK